MKKHKTTKLLCVTSKKINSLDVKNITDNKTFRKTVKPFLLDTVTSTQKITLIDNDKLVKNEDDTTKVLNTFLFKYC